MTVYVCNEFIADLVAHGDASFASRVLAKTVMQGMKAGADGNDHRYDGIEDCWIRYISRGATAYRAIYIRSNEDLYWYRAGSHSIEDRLAAPSAGAFAGAIVAAGENQFANVGSSSSSSYLKSTSERFLRAMIAERVLIPHRAVTIVTPRMSSEMYSPSGLVGRLIDRTAQCGGSVTVITRPPEADQRGIFRRISADVELLIHNRINARMIAFEIDRDQLRDELMHKTSVCIVGSAEISDSGLGTDRQNADFDELSYEIQGDEFSGAEDFIHGLLDQAITFENFLRR